MMQVILDNPANLWLAFGVLLIVVEAFTMPGLGLFLAGLGALCAGVLVEGGVVGQASTGAQFAWFFGLTVVWTIVLWTPLKNFRMRQKKPATEFKNMVGETAIVSKEGLKRGVTGQVAWSGTLMSAELDAASPAEVPAGAAVIITAVSGTTFTVTPK